METVKPKSRNLKLYKFVDKTSYVEPIEDSEGLL